MAASRTDETRPLIADQHVCDNLLPTISSPVTRKSTRNHALDNLRTFLTALVILHHTAIVYGGPGAWYIRSRCFPPESILLTCFEAINQTFFMALFFFISGHFTRMQMSKKGSSRSAVVYSRLLRILLPAVVYTMIIEPTLLAVVWAWGNGASDDAVPNVWSLYVAYWTHVRGIRGPVWYLALVMTFHTIAAFFLWSGKDYSQEPQRDILRQHKRIWAPLAWLLTIFSSFAIRLVYPVGTIWTPMSLQLAFLSQYVLAYVGGHLSVISGDLFILIPFQYTNRNTRRKLSLSLMAIMCSIGLLNALEARVLGVDLKRIFELSRGGFNVPALVYAVWNEMGFALIGFALVAIFLRYCDVPWTWRNFWFPRYSYAAFLLHPLLSAGLEIAMESFMGCRAGSHRSERGVWSLLGPVLLTFLVGVLNILTTWIAAWALLSAVPLIARII